MKSTNPMPTTPVVFDEHSTEPYGVGAFVLAGIEMATLTASIPAGR